MYVFLFLAIPSFLMCYCLSHKTYKLSNFIPTIIFGFFLSVVTCTIIEFFTFSQHLFTENRFNAFIKLFLHDALVPTAVLFLLYQLFSKDDVSFRKASVFPLLASFYAVAIPFVVFTSAEKDCIFFIFAKPMLYLTMCIWESVLISLFLSLKEAKKGALSYLMIIPCVACCIVPPAMETLWYYKTPLMFYLIPTIIFFASGIFMHFYILHRDSYSVASLQPSNEDSVPVSVK